jgi:hypothetical protein
MTSRLAVGSGCPLSCLGLALNEEKETDAVIPFSSLSRMHAYMLVAGLIAVVADMNLVDRIKLQGVGYRVLNGMEG